MTPRQRIKLAMEGKQPDRVPVWCPLSLEHIIRNGTDQGRIPETVEEFIEIECRLTKRYRFDGLLLYLPGLKAGAKVKPILEMLINTLPAGDSSHVFEEADPETWQPELPSFQFEDFYSARLARDILGEDFHIGGWTADGFSKAIQWFPGLDDALIGIIQDTQRFKAIVEYFDHQCVLQTRAQLKLGRVESIHISSPYAGSSFLSPDLYQQLVLPSVKKIVQAVEAENGFCYLHTCGFISDRLEWMAESGVDGIECLDPPPLGNVDLKEAKARVGDKIFLKGNIDSVNVLLRGTDEEVEQTVKKCLKDGMPGGGYILSTACSVAPPVPPERVQRLTELSEKYGIYEG